MQIAIFGSYGQGNIGDEAIADGLARIFHAALPESQLVLFSHLGTELQEGHSAFVSIRPMIASGFRSLWRQLHSGIWQENQSIIAKSDWIVIGGGGIFHDQEIGQTGRSPMFIWWLRTLFFTLLGKKIALAAIGIGPLTHRLSTFFLSGILKRASIITVRDQASCALAQKHTTKTITVTPDPVWGLFTSDEKKNSSHSYSLGINVRETQRFDQKTLIKKLTNIIDQVLQNHPIKTVQLIPFALHQPDDREMMLPLSKVLQDHYQLPVTIEIPHSTEHAFELITGCNSFIATRFHSYIFAKSAGIDCELLSYSVKTDEITKQTVKDYLDQQRSTIDFWQKALGQH